MKNNTSIQIRWICLTCYCLKKHLQTNGSEFDGFHPMGSDSESVNKITKDFAGGRSQKHISKTAPGPWMSRDGS